MGAKMANITRIRAKDEKSTEVKAPARTKKRREKREQKVKRPMPKFLRPLYVLFTPLRALGRYVHESLVEVRQVRWPNRKATWKLTLSVIIYVIIMAVAVMLLDALLTLIFNNLIKG